MNSDKLINENNQLRENLNSENKRYYEDLLVYIRSKSTFNREKDVEQLLLDMLHDLIDAQSNGESASSILVETQSLWQMRSLKHYLNIFLIFLR